MNYIPARIVEPESLNVMDTNFQFIKWYSEQINIYMDGVDHIITDCWF